MILPELIHNLAHYYLYTCTYLICMTNCIFSAHTSLCSQIPQSLIHSTSLMDHVFQKSTNVVMKQSQKKFTTINFQEIQYIFIYIISCFATYTIFIFIALISCFYFIDCFAVLILYLKYIFASIQFCLLIFIILFFFILY